ncbi:MAG: inositol monophosphatase family protein [Sphaerochaetaceae bacterium]|jgi:fructose-1,6-bisphosphatase/inositol monophosphatase family enzyme
MDSYDQVAQLILQMGSYAATEQAHVVRTYKEDGTILTKTDTTINEKISSLLASLFPQANIITEEALRAVNPSAPLTFILDPIDGTDSYSQGLPGWAIALGILDQKRQPIGAMVYAPRWGHNNSTGLFLRQDPYKELLLNDSVLTTNPDRPKIHAYAIASHIIKHCPIQRLDAKIRSFGSNILHMISALSHPYIEGAVSYRCFAWDIAAAHALLSGQGFVVEDEQGAPFTYTDELLVERKSIPGFVFSGTRVAVNSLQKQFSCPDHHH